MSYADMVKRSGPLQSSLSAVAAIPKPTVAAITGYALGGGCELALCADYRIAAEDAKLGQPEILLGIIPGAGGTQRLSRLVGPSKAKDLIYTGRFVDAAESLPIGLVDKVVPAAEVYDAAVAWASQFSGGAALALRAAKEAIDSGLGVDLHDRAGDRAAAVRRAVRHRGPRDRDEVLRRERPRQGRVQGNLNDRRLLLDEAGRHRRRGRGGLERQQARPGALPRLGGVDVRREVVDLVRRTLRHLRPRPVHRDRRRRRLALRQVAGDRRRHRLLHAEPQAGRRARRGARHRPLAGHGRGGEEERDDPRASRSRAGSPTRRSCRTTTTPSTSSSGTPSSTTSRTSSWPSARCSACSSRAAGSSSAANPPGTATTWRGGCPASPGGRRRT